MSSIKNSTCKIIVETQSGVSEEKGTGFFISKNQILTCKHILDNLTGQIKIEKCYNQNGQKLTAKIVEQCGLTDYALLKLIEDFESEHFLELCNSEIIEEETIKIFGYPDEGQGQDTGELLNGHVHSRLAGEETIQDVSLSISGYNINTKYGGFSGSPVVNEYDQVTSIVKYQGARNLSSVSVNKAILFLEKNDINVQHDQIASFELFKTGVFESFGDRERECILESEKPIKNLTPKKIIESKKDEIFYPKKKLELKDLIKHLRKNKKINDKLWKGWIQLLTYVEILKGDYSDANSISIKISTKIFSQFLGINFRSKDVDLEIFLNFYFSEDADYFDIAKMSIHESRNSQITKHTCNIFNSHIENFGNTDRIIPDISNPNNSGPSISNVKVGTLSLSQLNRAVINSLSLNEMNDNLKNIFENAINKSKLYN